MSYNKGNYRRYRLWLNDKILTCPKCTTKVTGRRINIHHIDHDVSNDSHSNFQLLCESCHKCYHLGETNKRRCTGVALSNEHKKKISEHQKINGNPMKGRKHTKEALEKISIASKAKKGTYNYVMSDEHKNNLWKNRPRTSRRTSCLICKNEIGVNNIKQHLRRHI